MQLYGKLHVFNSKYIVFLRNSFCLFIEHLSSPIYHFYILSVLLDHTCLRD